MNILRHRKQDAETDKLPPERSFPKRKICKLLQEGNVADSHQSVLVGLSATVKIRTLADQRAFINQSRTQSVTVALEVRRLVSP